MCACMHVCMHEDKTSVTYVIILTCSAGCCMLYRLYILAIAGHGDICCMHGASCEKKL